jgi:hypothetical protein
MKPTNEYENFSHLAERLLAVPHSEVKKKLDAEKRARRRKKAKKPSASREGV